MKIRKFSKPFEHIFIENFLQEKTANEILSEIKKSKLEIKKSDLFKFKQTKDLTSSDKKSLKQFIQILLNKEFKSLLERTFRKKINGKIDIFGSLYENTDFLLPHDDMLEDRKIAYIYYLSNMKKEDGGEISLFKTKNNAPILVSKKHQPKFNSLILFEVSRRSFHQVEEVLTNKKRYSLTGWFY